MAAPGAGGAPLSGQDARPQSLLDLDQVRLAGPFSQGFQQPQREIRLQAEPNAFRATNCFSLGHVPSMNIY